MIDPGAAFGGFQKIVDAVGIRSIDPAHAPAAVFLAREILRKLGKRFADRNGIAFDYGLVAGVTADLVLVFDPRFGFNQQEAQVKIKEAGNIPKADTAFIHQDASYNSRQLQDYRSSTDGGLGMGRCEFCQCNFEHRPQVKNPRACGKLACQRLRQRTNEREWRDRQPLSPGANYHEIRRGQRTRKIKRIAATLTKCFETGRRFLGLDVSIEVFAKILEVALLDLGLRKINKFWRIENASDSVDLDGLVGQGFVQTS
jgi:hypothetical protein